MPKNITAKPFVKWAGGKGKLLQQLESLLPDDFDEQENVCYIDPFVGGGAMLFHMLQNHPNIRRAVINDINEDLINAYRIIRDELEELLPLLRDMQEEYESIKTHDERKARYLEIREFYNVGDFTPVERAAYTLFINHTCFNGLYRVNSKGKFNVPYGRYQTVHIFDEEVLRRDSELLQNVEIVSMDYRKLIEFAQEGAYNFFYLDPPYRPLNETSTFNDYQSEKWGDEQQMQLKLFCDRLNEMGAIFMESNSDSYDNEVNFFEGLYDGYEFSRVLAPRFINAIATKRSSITELVIRNYTNPKEDINATKIS